LAYPYNVILFSYKNKELIHTTRLNLEVMLNKRSHIGKAQWLIPIIPTSLEIEMRRIMI
jgi:hypothetical protein